MVVFKCKMCGGDLSIIGNEKVAECEYCGTKQTLPNLSDQKRNLLLDRANYFRRINDYDKAMSIYEQLLTLDQEDAELYWSIVLCKFGIEYVIDPKTKERIPTINRTQFKSIFADEDYLKAVSLASPEQIDIYENEATRIYEIQQGILSISQQEEPYDIFICYKETDASGRRTVDSVYAQNIYNDLTSDGYRVFFARISLEDKLGSAYEPYIFAALTSAKVMIVVGTNRENFNAVWVKNEWSRYLNLIQKGEKKTLIPAYKDMDAYELPEEFAYLQAQDISKVGYMQDLLHGIHKLLPKVNKSVQTNSDNNFKNMANSLIDKALAFLKSGDVRSASLCLDNAYAYDTTSAMYYVANLFIERKCFDFESLSKQTYVIDRTGKWFSESLKYSDDALKRKLELAYYYTVYNDANNYDENSFIEDLIRSYKLLTSCDLAYLKHIDLGLAKNYTLTIDELKELIIEKANIRLDEASRLITASNIDTLISAKNIICDDSIEFAANLNNALNERHNGLKCGINERIVKRALDIYEKVENIFARSQSYKNISEAKELLRSKEIQILCDINVLFGEKVSLFIEKMDASVIETANTYYDDALNILGDKLVSLYGTAISNLSSPEVEFACLHNKTFSNKVYELNNITLTFGTGCEKEVKELLL